MKHNLGRTEDTTMATDTDIERLKAATRGAERARACRIIAEAMNPGPGQISTEAYFALVARIEDDNA